GKARPGIITFEGAMHGRTMGAALMGGNPGSRAWVGHDDPNLYRLDFPTPWALGNMTGAERARRDLQALEARGIDLARDVCGILLETYQGWGAIFYPADYVQAMADYARANNVLLTFDEIQSGFGRTGELFGYQHYGVEPDLICCGKGMSSSLPLAAVLGRAEVMDLAEIGSMSSTHSANPLVCAAGLANIEVIEDENLVAEARRKGELLHQALDALRKRWPKRISHVLGKGMVAAVLVVDPETGAADGASASRICELCLQRGLLLVHTGRESIKMGPPLVTPDDALLEGVEVLAGAMADVFGG
ncbi:MAG TPA: aspartate aminotransferase family protein, partial [Candidatus Omnitrophota bacterium]|nr:aspartate aminotransferase family protein [Candidatus Omnitrophota bacterium]